MEVCTRVVSRKVERDFNDRQPLETTRTIESRITIDVTREAKVSLFY
jgi:hypothetical protein